MTDTPQPDGAVNAASATDKFVVVAANQQELDEARAALAGVPGVRFELVESGQNGGLRVQTEGSEAAPKPAENPAEQQPGKDAAPAAAGDGSSGDESSRGAANQVADEKKSGAPLDDIGGDQNPPPVSEPENLEQPRGRVR